MRDVASPLTMSMRSNRPVTLGSRACGGGAPAVRLEWGRPAARTRARALFSSLGGPRPGPHRDPAIDNAAVEPAGGRGRREEGSGEGWARRRTPRMQAPGPQHPLGEPPCKPPRSSLPRARSLAGLGEERVQGVVLGQVAPRRDADVLQHKVGWGWVGRGRQSGAVRQVPGRGRAQAGPQERAGHRSGMPGPVLPPALQAGPACSSPASQERRPPQLRPLQGPRRPSPPTGPAPSTARAASPHEG